MTTKYTAPAGFVPRPAQPDGLGADDWLGPSAGLVSTSWDEGLTMVHVNVEDYVTVDEARQLLVDLTAVLAKLEGAE
ncbi:hypothetical protein [Arthrobacter mobilis]|uniref:Uncharacterized protein n=1 Tax=Arthrobacter mobilis TaxID=2724944 RepID=A0A7X6HDZ1_9MICC|nr:hypothetical protein [Arthrobacter mobilis]NKX55301.1 hypothetical protein [Arthrobacter mobilis]